MILTEAELLLVSRVERETEVLWAWRCHDDDIGFSMFLIGEIMMEVLLWNTYAFSIMCHSF